MPDSPGHAALIDTDSWQWPDVFAWLQQAGNIEQREMLTTFNCGIGFLLIVGADDAEPCMQLLRERGEAPVRIGQIVSADTAPGSNQILVS